MKRRRKSRPLKLSARRSGFHRGEVLATQQIKSRNDAYFEVAILKFSEQIPRRRKSLDANRSEI